MKTLGYVLSDFPVLSETFIGNEMRAVEAIGHGVVPLVLSHAREEGQPTDAELAARALRLPNMGAADGIRGLALGLRRLHRWLPFVLRYRALPRRSLVWAAAKIASVAARNECNHLHAHFALASAATAIVAGRMLGISVSFTGHGYDVYPEPDGLETTLQATDFAVAVCEDMRTRFETLAPETSVGVVPCGIDPTAFIPSAAAHDDEAIHLLSVGRLVDKKGIDTTLAALSGLPEDLSWSLTVVGDGAERAPLERMAAALGIANRVAFVGRQSADWIAAAMRRHTALIAPFREGRDGGRDTGPLVVKEAMASGLPVLSTAFMGVKETVAPSCGWLVEPGDVLGLRQAVQDLAKLSPSERRQRGLAGRARVEKHFSIQHQAAGLSDLIEAA